MVSFNDADDFISTMSAGGGKAFRFTDIDGIGPATADKIKSIRGVRAPTDVTEMSADELADKAGISRSRAEKAIRGAGGNPNVSKQSNTGSVSAAGIKNRTGDFWVEFAAQDKARARNDPRSRSEEAVRQDEQKRAPITTDLEQWKNNKSGFDFPGVDTPTQNPKALPKDYKRGGDFQTTGVDEESEVATRTERTVADQYPEGAAGSSLRESFFLEVAQRPGVAEQDFEKEAPTRGRDPTIGPEPSSERLPAPIKENLASGKSADVSFVQAEQTRSENQRNNQRQEFDFPAWTISRGQTYLNEKVYGEGRNDLEPLRNRVADTKPSEDSLALTDAEYNTFQRIVRSEAKEEIERADRMEANIFGDTDQQAEVAEQALQGIINNPPR